MVRGKGYPRHVTRYNTVAHVGRRVAEGIAAWSAGKLAKSIKERIASRRKKKDQPSYSPIKTKFKRLVDKFKKYLGASVRVISMVASTLALLLSVLARVQIC